MILSQSNGSRTIIFNPGTLNPLNLDEFKSVFKNGEEKYSWIHFEARPHVQEMLQYLRHQQQKDIKSSKHSKYHSGWARKF